MRRHPTDCRNGRQSAALAPPQVASALLGRRRLRNGPSRDSPSRLARVPGCMERSSVLVVPARGLGCPEGTVSSLACWWLLCSPSRRPPSPRTNFSDSSKGAIGVCSDPARTDSSVFVDAALSDGGVGGFSRSRLVQLIQSESVSSGKAVVQESGRTRPRRGARRGGRPTPRSSSHAVQQLVARATAAPGQACPRRGRAADKAAQPR